MFDIDTKFIGTFKVGDNLRENIQMLSALYLARRNANAENKKLLVKPVVVWIGAITETLLSDFLDRARLFHREGVKNVPAQRLNHLRNRNNKDKFADYIKAAKEIQIFGKPNSQIYKDLDKLRELRNRLHIHILGPGVEVDSEIFNYLQIHFSEKVLEQVLRSLSTSYTRNGRDYVGGFQLPWRSHFEEEDI